MEKTRTIEEKYVICDWCSKEIPDGYDKSMLYYITGDFETLVVHKEPCLRQAVATGIKNRPPLDN